VRALCSSQLDLGTHSNISLLSSNIKCFFPKRATLNVEIVNSKALAASSVNKVLSGLLTENELLSEFYDRIGAVTRSAGRLLIKVTDAATQAALEGRSVLIDGNPYQLSAPNVMASLFYVAFFCIDSPEDAQLIFHGFQKVGQICVFFCPRDVDQASQIPTSTWRFYFPCETIPPSFVVNGHPVNRILCEGRVFYVTTKGAPSPGPNTPARTRAVHQLCLASADTTQTPPASANSSKKNGRKQGTSSSSAPAPGQQPPASAADGNSAAPANSNTPPTAMLWAEVSRKRTRARLGSAEVGRLVAQRHSVNLHDDNFFACPTEVPVDVCYAEPGEGRFAHIRATAESFTPAHPDSSVKPLQYKPKSKKGKVQIGESITISAAALALQATEVMDDKTLTALLPEARVRSTSVRIKLQSSHVALCVGLPQHFEIVALALGWSLVQWNTTGYSRPARRLLGNQAGLRPHPEGFCS
jgi:hypothetical protein